MAQLAMGLEDERKDAAPAVAPVLALRDYQLEAVDKTVAAEDAGSRKLLGVAATGMGKTIIFAALARQLNRPTLILAHRDELISQAAAKVQQMWPEAHIGVVKAERNEVDAHVVVASVQTLSRSSRREQLPVGKFGLVIVDESHHATATSYRAVLEHVRAGEPDGPLLLGVTATPDRGDGTGLIEVFNEVVFSYDMLWGIRSGYLSDIRGMRVHLDTDFRKVKISKGDYDAGQAGRMLEDADAPALIIQAWLKYASDRKTLVFTPTVATAEMVTMEAIKQGISAATVAGATPLEERREILRRYASGDIRILSNCGVLTEGYDDPATSCIVVARPTRSRALYTQIIGRGTRRHPDKTDCLVIDVVGATAEHSLVTVPSLFGIKKESNFENAERTIAEAAQDQVEDEIREGTLRATEADMFRKVLDSPMAWVHFQNQHSQTSYLCSLGSAEKGSIIVEPLPSEPGDETHYDCYIQWQPDKAPDDVEGLKTYPDGSSVRSLISGVDIETAQGVGEDFIRKNGAAHLVDKNAAWRKNPPTARQIEAAGKWRLVVNPEWDAGQLSEALSSHIATKKAKSRNRPQWAGNKARGKGK